MNTKEIVNVDNLRKANKVDYEALNMNFHEYIPNNENQATADEVIASSEKMTDNGSKIFLFILSVLLIIFYY